MKRTISLFVFGTAAGAAACGSGTATDSASVGSVQDELHIARNKIAAEATQVNLVSDEEGVAAVQDTDLVNAWGLAFNPAGAAWVSAAETGLSPVFDAAGNTLLTVTIPPPEGAEGPAAPTGQVFNARADDFKGDTFIFATENGTIAGWQRSDGTTAVIRVDNSKSDAIYKGVDIAREGRHARLYATDFHNAKIDAFDDEYQPTNLAGSFDDASLPAGFAPFNVHAVAGRLIVTYALQDEDAEDDVKGPGNGFVDVFDLEGHLLQRLLSQGELNSPWGVAIGPTRAGGGDIDLLIGNFGDGRINVYDVSFSFRHHRFVARFEGAVGDAKGKPIEIDGLWALEYGPGAGGFSRHDLYFTAGPDNEEHGLFGKLVFGRAK